MIDRRFIGHVFPAFSVDVEKGRLRFFAKATGQTDPVYIDEAAAVAAGYPSLPVPPTFFYCLHADMPDPRAMQKLLGYGYGTLLHGEQGFVYHRMAFAGDRLQLQSQIEDIYDKKNGELEFVVRKTTVCNQHAQRVVEMRAVTVIRAAKGG